MGRKCPEWLDVRAGMIVVGTKARRLPPTEADASDRGAGPGKRRTMVVMGGGFSLVEMLLVVAVLGILAAITFPAVARTWARAEAEAARNAFVAGHSLARQVAGQYGGLGKLHLDTARNVFWVTVDTSTIPDLQAEDTIGPPVYVGDRFGGVRMRTGRRLLCFHPGGLGTAAGGCDLPNATIVFGRGSVAETLTVSRLGRVRKW